MKIKVKYKQKCESFGLYSFYRIIDLTPARKLFKRKLITLICNTWNNSKIEYCKKVRSVLSMTEQEVKEWIEPDIREFLSNPECMNEEISSVKIELDI